MQIIPLSAVPNQQLTLRLDDDLYSIALKTVRDITIASVTRNQVKMLDGVRLVAGQPMLPYRYKETGNFVMVTANDALPLYSEFGVTQQLVYLSAAELAAARAAGFAFDPDGAIPLRAVQPAGYYSSGVQAVNYIRNNTMVGGAAGTPGTLPTNWTNFIGGGLSQQLVGFGSEDFINYVDWRVFGTASASSGAALYPETTTQIVAANGQDWCLSGFVRLVGGSLSGIDLIRFLFNEKTAGGGAVGNEYGNGFIPTTNPLGWQRQHLGAVLAAGVTVERVQPAFEFGFTNGAVIDVTLRFGLPQMERGLLPTATIRTP